MGFELLVLLARGPYCRRHTWFGYERDAAQEVVQRDMQSKDADVEKAETVAASSTETLGVPELPVEGRPPDVPTSDIVEKEAKGSGS
jgi:hypothetical protein